MSEANKVVSAIAIMFLVGGIVMLAIDREASLVLVLLSSITFLTDKVMRVKASARKPRRRYRIYNLQDGSEIKGEV